MFTTIVLDYYSGNRKKVISLLNEMQLAYVETDSISSFLNNVGFNNKPTAISAILLLGEHASHYEIMSLTSYIQRYKPDIKFFIYSCDNSVIPAGLNADHYKICNGDETELVKTVHAYISSRGI
jgi:hypothetical protein